MKRIIFLGFILTILLTGCSTETADPNQAFLDNCDPERVGEYYSVVAPILLFDYKELEYSTWMTKVDSATMRENAIQTAVNESNSVYLLIPPGCLFEHRELTIEFLSSQMDVFEKYMDKESIRAQGYVGSQWEEEINAELNELDDEKNFLLIAINSLVETVRDAEKELYISTLPTEE